ncbi:MAG TPA: hypothetical protein VKB71_04065 [Rhizomicrobium sp.]|jgi:hypothetical protein|nr:hypothetical protein [Rhizomicrobium sp.]
MPATAIRSRIPEFEPDEIDEIDEADEPSYIIGAHADYSRDDFIFPRMQSRTMRETPWGARTGRMRSWSELAGIGFLLLLASFAVVVSTAFV